MPVIKRISEGFTIIESACLRDEQLDLSERGLLCTMLSLPDGWNFSGLGLTSILPCGKSKVFSSLKKLEERGYLKRVKIYKDGKVADWEYQISGKPVFLKEPVEEAPKIVKKQNKKPKENLLTENQEVGFFMPKNNDCEQNINLVTDFQEVEKLEVENRQDNIILNNQILNNDLYINQSYQRTNIHEPTKKKKHSDMIDKIKQQIDFEILADTYKNDNRVDEIVKIIADTLCSTKSSIRINGEFYDIERVKERFLSLDYDNIQYALIALDNNKTEIRNIKSYMLTTLYNSSATMENYYSNHIQTHIMN